MCFLSLPFFLLHDFYPFSALMLFFYVDLEPFSIYHPTSEEAPTTTSAPMEGFFDRVNVVAEAMASASVATTQGAPTETLVLPSEPIPTEEST